MAKVYGDFGDFERFWGAKNKPNSKHALSAVEWANHRPLAGNPKH